MAKDKYDFIQNILDSKKITPAQKERVLNLAISELVKDGISGSQLELRVKKLENLIEPASSLEEKKIGLISDFNDKIKNDVVYPKVSSESSERKMEYINPFKLYQFLLEYNKNPILRSLAMI